MDKCTAVLVTAALAVILQFASVAGNIYTVGAPGGSWDLSTNYTKWVSNITFYPGDSLLFSYASSHDVWEVTKSDYETCAIGTPLKKYTSGNDVIALTETGSRYFYCSVGSHCSRGMKLAVSVVSPSAPNAPPSTPSPSSPSPPPSSSPSPPSPSPPSPPPSSSPSPPSPTTVVTPPPPAPSSGAAGVSVFGSPLAVALVLGAILMIFV